MATWGGPIAELTAAVGGALSTDPADLAAVAHDLWPLALIRDRQGRPLPIPSCVVWPSTAAEVAAVLRTCSESGTPVVALGAGTGVCGAAVPVRGGVVLDCKRLNRIAGWELESGYVIAEPGVLGIDLEEAALRRGWSLGHYPSSLPISTVGGFLATRSVGQLSTRYGRLEECVAGLRVILPDGTEVIMHAQPSSGTGPDLRRLFLGSEGLFGVIVEATLRLHRVPETRVDAAWRLPGFHAGIGAAREVLQAGLRPSLLRLYDDDDTALQAHHLGIGEGEGALMLCSSEGRDGPARAEAAEVDAICRAAGGEGLGDGPVATWYRRRYELGYQQAVHLPTPAMVIDTIEVAAPWARLAALHRAVREARPPRLLALCHLSHGYGDGACLYFTFAGTAETEEDSPALYHELWRTVMRAVVDSGGSIGHHHGVGLARSPYLVEELGAGGLEVLRRLKTALDPAGVANPGKWGLE